MTNTSYYVKPRYRVLNHVGRRHSHGSLLLNDWSENDSPSEINALVASGDCFITLATALESITQTLTVDKPTVSPQLEKLTSTLLYLQRHYQIGRKEADHRQ